MALHRLLIFSKEAGKFIFSVSSCRIVFFEIDFFVSRRYLAVSLQKWKDLIDTPLYKTIPQSV